VSPSDFAVVPASFKAYDENGNDVTNAPFSLQLGTSID